MTAIQLKNVNKNLGNFRLKNIDLDIERGFITGLIGENGAGKTSLIHLILGLKKPDAGEISLFGNHAVEAHREALLNRIGFVFAEDRFPEKMTVPQLKKILKRFYEDFNAPQFDHYIRKFKIREKQKFKNYSTGERMKLSIAIALSHNAELLVLDEPTSNLDPNFRIEFLEILQALMEDENMTILFSTHITSDLDSIGDYIIMIDEGEIVFHEEKDLLLEKYKKIKGPVEILDAETEDLLTGIKKTTVGFEAISDEHRALEELYGSKILTEQLRIDELMHHLKKGKDV